jgi:hypothetical protein
MVLNRHHQWHQQMLQTRKALVLLQEDSAQLPSATASGHAEHRGNQAKFFVASFLVQLQ